MMRIQLSDPSHLSDLIAALAKGGCVPTPVDDGAALEVFHPGAPDARHARTELTFFLRAWRQAHPDVELTFG